MGKKFLSVLLAICMAVCILPSTALAAETANCENGDACEIHVAAIGNNHYDTLLEAVEAARENDTITLLKDYTVTTSSETSYWIADNCVFDLGGHTLTVPFMAAIFEGNHITIQNGRFESDANYAVWIGNGDLYTTATLKDISSNGGVNVFVASAVLENCNIDASTKNYYAIWGDEGNVEITIKSGAYLGGFVGGTQQVVVNACAGSAGSDPAKIYIEDGNFTGAVWTQTSNGATGQVIITGGSYNTDVGDYIPDGAALVQDSSGKISASSDDAAAVARVNGIGYDTLSNAIAAVSDGGIVTLEKDTEITGNFLLIEKSFILDLNGCELTNNSYYGFYISSNVVFTVRNGSISGTYSSFYMTDGQAMLENVSVYAAGDAAIWIYNSAEVTVGTGASVSNDSANYSAIFIGHNDGYSGSGIPVLNVSGSVISNAHSTIAGNGNDHIGTQINIYDGAAIAGTVAIYHPQAGELNIYGGTVEGSAGIGIKSGTLNILGGTILGTSTSNELSDADSVSNGIRTDGSAIVVDSNINYAGSLNINISGNATIQSLYSTAIREIGSDEGATNIVSLKIAGEDVSIISGEGADVILVREPTVEHTNVSGGNFSVPVNVEYLDPSLTAELYSLGNPQSHIVITHLSQRRSGRHSRAI